MKITAPRNMAEALAAFNMALVEDIQDDRKTTNRLLLQQLLMQKMLVAATDVGIDWDTYEVWVEPGSYATKITPVIPGEIVVVKLLNLDFDNAGTVYYGYDRSVKPVTRTGWGFKPFTVVTGTNDAWDFNEGGGNLAATIAPGPYTTGAAAADAIQTAVLAAGGTNVYTFIWNDALKKFQQRAVGPTPAPFTATPATGPNAATSVKNDINWTADVAATAYPWIATANGIVVSTGITGEVESHILTGFPLVAGEPPANLVASRDVYGILDSTHPFRVPICVRRSYIVKRRAA